MIKYIKNKKGDETMSDKIVATKRICKWGDGLGVLLPQQVVEKMELKAGDKLVLEMENEVITLKKESDVLVIPRFKLEDLLKGYDGYQNEEYWKDVEPVGEEVW